MYKSLHHVCIMVKNLDESVAFWEKLLSVKAKVAGPLPSGIKLAQMALPGGGELELMQPVNPDSEAAKTLAAQGEGVRHICFEVDDVDKELARAGQCGAQGVDAKSRAALNYRIGFYRAGSISVELLQKQ